MRLVLQIHIRTNAIITHIRILSKWLLVSMINCKEISNPASLIIIIIIATHLCMGIRLSQFALHNYSYACMYV